MFSHQTRDVTGSDAGHRLVEQQQPGIGGHQRGDLKLALVAMTDVTGRGVQPMCEPDLPEHIDRPGGGRVVSTREVQQRIAPAQRGLDRHPDVLEDAELREQARGLERAPQPCPGPLGHGQGGDVIAVEQDATGCGPDHARDRVEQCGLARAVRPDDPDEGTGRDVEVDILEDRRATDLQAETLDAERRTAGLVVGQGWGVVHGCLASSYGATSAASTVPTSSGTNPEPSATSFAWYMSCRSA